MTRNTLLEKELKTNIEERRDARNKIQVALSDLKRTSSF